MVASKEVGHLSPFSPSWENDGGNRTEITRVVEKKAGYSCFSFQVNVSFPVYDCCSLGCAAHLQSAFTVSTRAAIQLTSPLVNSNHRASIRVSAVVEDRLV